MVSGTNSAVPSSCWLSVTRPRGTPQRRRAVDSVTRSPDRDARDPGEVALDHGDSLACPLLGGAEPAAAGDAVAEQRALRTPHTTASSPASRASFTSAGWIVADARSRADRLLGAAVEGGAAGGPDPHVLEVVVPRGTGRLGRRRSQREHREQVADRERDDQRGGEAAALAPPDGAEPSCIVRGRKLARRSARSSAPCPPTTEPVDSSASRRSMRTPRRIAGRAASGGAEQARRATLTATTGTIDAEADVDGPELRAEEARGQVRDRDAERDPRRGTERAEQRRRAHVHERDLPAAGRRRRA